MPDPITVLGLTKTASEGIKEAMDFARNAKNTELAQKLIDVYKEMMLVVETNQELRKEIEEMKKRADVTSRLRFESEETSYFLRREGQNDDGPFCGTCWDIDGKLVRKSRGEFGMTACNYCWNFRPRRR